MSFVLVLFLEWRKSRQSWGVIRLRLEEKHAYQW